MVLVPCTMKRQGASFNFSNSTFTPKDLNPIASAASLNFKRLLPILVVSESSRISCNEMNLP